MHPGPERLPPASSVGEHRLDEHTQPPMAKRQNRRRQRKEGNVGEPSNDPKELCWGAAVVVEIGDGDDAGSPGRDEQDDKGKDHLEEHEGVSEDAMKQHM